MALGYLVNFNDSNTGKQHFLTLKEKGIVLWGQWKRSINGINVSPTRQRIMNEHPFYLYAFDRTVALLKMHCIHVYQTEEVIANKLTHLIPSYYSINTPCSAFYLIDNIEILPAVYAKNLIAINSGKEVFENARQVNNARPWHVKEKEPFLSFQPPEPIIDYNNLGNYSVYCYHSKTANKDYIGLTNDVIRRRREHECSSNWVNSKKYLYVYMTLMGIEDFEFTVLHTNLTKEQAKYYEALEIELHNSYYPDGFNERYEGANLGLQVTFQN